MTPAVCAGFLVAAGVGAAARFLLDAYFQTRFPGTFPWGTLVVNLSGCLLLGLLVGYGLDHDPGSAAIVLGTGGLGAYTTFSTFSVETMRLIHQGERRRAAINIGTNILGGLGAALIGLSFPI